MNVVSAKPFAWSFSRLKAYEDCPRRYYETQIKKGTWDEPRSGQLEWGDAVHLAMATALKNKTPLPTTFRIFQKWVDKVANTPGELLVEDDCRWACDRHYSPVPWFAKNVWLRTVADAVKLDSIDRKHKVALIVDWKAGKSSNADPIQLQLTSLMAFLQFPELLAVRSDFVWLQEDDHTTQVVYKSEAPDLWAQIIPRVERLHQASLDVDFPPVPGKFCRRWCPVKSCEHWGK